MKQILSDWLDGIITTSRAVILTDSETVLDLYALCSLSDALDEIWESYGFALDALPERAMCYI